MSEILPRIEIPLGRGICAYADLSDEDLISGQKWHLNESIPGYRYASNRRSGKVRWLHRVIMGVPDGVRIKFMDGDGLNCCRSNLSVATHADTMRRRRPQGGQSRFKGVTNGRRLGQNWRAYIRVEGKTLWLGTFDTEQLAAAAYDDAATRYFGRFALTNEDLGLFAEIQEAA